MTTSFYVRSTDGDNADDGSTWLLAKVNIAGVGANDSAGDIAYVSQVHSESQGNNLTYNGAGTNGTPCQILCANDGAQPPTTLTTGAVVTVTGNFNIILIGSMYVYGIKFVSGGQITLNDAASNYSQFYEQCSFQITNTGSAGVIASCGTFNQTYKCRLRDCTFKLANAANTFTIYGDVVIEGGSVVSGSSSPTSFFNLPGDRSAGSLLCTGFDFSNFGSGFNLCGVAGLASSKMVFRNCKLPSSWSGSLVASGISGPGQRYEMYNCDSANTNYRLWVEDYAGSVKSETTIVRSSGASDGTTSLSWKMVTSANSKFPLHRLESPEIVVWNDTTGSSVTLTIQIVHDTNVAGGQGAGASSAFQNDEIWVEVAYLGDASFAESTRISSCKADVLAAAADISSSSVTWTTTGLTTPVKQAMAVTFTPQKKGFYIAKVVMAKASKTIYVCPKADLS